ncbi:TnsA endonuclease N-terminal domain-containing protein [Tissierella sp.]|jgi:hypothetical protein|uniref:TnsA endonuclease N-terminal domain-containing protein n=1 Tax=Tissierella sp. TaxID=41274 RepID=UPI00304A6CE1
MDYKYKNPINMTRGSHYGSNYWEVYSKKINRNVKLFSNLEFENFLSIELNPEIEYFCEQPLEVEVVIDGDKKKAIFDMWVKYKDGSEEFQEVKYLSEINGDTEKSVRTNRQIEIQKKWCADNIQNYVIRTDNEIQKGRFTIRNLKFIAGKIRRYNLPNKDFYQEKLTSYLRNHYDKVKIKDIIESEFLPKARELDYLFLMFYLGIIKLEIDDMPISKDTGVSIWQPKN